MNTETPSTTARKVALNIISLGAKAGMEKALPSGLVEATEELLVKAGVTHQGTVDFCRSQMAIKLYEAFNWLMPGQFEAFAHRKTFFEYQVKAGIEDGSSQILVLGAGYDTLGWRLAPEFPAVSFFEIDHPATARLKAKGIQAMEPRDNLHLIAEDLSQRQLKDVLKQHSAWETSASTLIVAEGLLMYLAPEAVGALFEQCAKVSGPGSRLAFSYIGQGTHGNPDVGPWTALVLWQLRIIGEPWLWWIHPDALSSFLNEHDWAIASKSERCGIEFLGVAKRQCESQ